jgi:hypothetical protein
MAKASGIRQFGIRLAHRLLMNDTITADTRELLRHYDALPPEDRERVLLLVRSLRRMEEELRLSQQVRALRLVC